MTDAKPWMTLARLGLSAGLLLALVQPEALARHRKKDVDQPRIPHVAAFADAAQNPYNPSDLKLETHFPDKAWWQKFNDPQLDLYMAMAFQSNNTLAIAQARVREERALARYTLAQQFPILSLNPSVVRLRNSATSIPSFASSAITPAGPTTTTSATSTVTAPASSSSSGSSSSFVLGKPFTIYSFPLEVDYEADIFLKRRDQTKSARFLERSAEFDLQTTAISLATDVASTYFNLMAEDKLIALQEEYIRISQADVDAERARYLAGLTSNETVVIKEGLLANARAALQDYDRLQRNYVNQLAILLGRTPEEAGTLKRQDLDVFDIPSAVDSGLPSQLITRRPDILSNEALLAKSRIDVRVARKDLLPTFDLSAQFGTTSAALRSLFNWQSRVMTLSAAMAQTLFSGGAREANIRVYRARLEEQLGQYQQTILVAFDEVDNSLASLKTHRNAYQDYQLALNSLNQQLSLQQLQLQSGAIPPSDLYPTQEQVVQAQEGLVTAKLLGLADQLNLYKALGGGY